MKRCIGCGGVKPLGEFNRAAKNPDGRSSRCRDCHNAARRDQRAARLRVDPGAPSHMKEWKQNNPEGYKHYLYRLRLRRFNLTPEAYEGMVVAQGDRCAICRQEQPGLRLAVDHDHACCATSKRSCGQCVRGLLCAMCNRLLGWFENNREAILAYLEGNPPSANR